MKSVSCLIFGDFSSPLSGCDGGPSSPKNRADQFRSDQSATITPHGKILSESVREEDDGSLGYQTTDGRNWNVKVEQNSDGTRRYVQSTEKRSPE